MLAHAEGRECEHENRRRAESRRLRGRRARTAACDCRSGPAAVILAQRRGGTTTTGQGAVLRSSAESRLIRPRPRRYRPCEPTTITAAASSPAIRESSLAGSPTSARRSAPLSKLVLARDPLEQPLTRSVRLHAARIYAVGTAVAVNDVREYEPQSERPAEARRDFDRLVGTGRLVNSAHDGLHYRLAQTRPTSSSIGHAEPHRYQWKRPSSRSIDAPSLAGLRIVSDAASTVARAHPSLALCFQRRPLTRIGVRLGRISGFPQPEMGSLPDTNRDHDRAT